MSTVIHRPWLAQNLAKNLQAIGDARASLLQACQLFDITRYIRPIECYEIQDTLLALQSPVQEVCEVLYYPEHLPIEAISPRFKLVSLLYQLDSSVSRLSQELARFAPVCLISSDKALFQQQMIEEKLEHMAQTIEYVESVGAILIKHLR
jgi:hypothetical protein